MWERLYQRLVAGEGREIIRPPKGKIDAALKRVEAEVGVRLPAGYKAFIHQFGPGEVGGYFRIFGPKIPGFADWGNDILEEIKSWREPEGAWADVAPPELVARLLCFSTTIGGDACFWDPQDVREATRHEYGIYVWPHGRSSGTVTELAGSFEEFIERVCLGNGFDKIGGGWEPEPGPPQQFTPA